MKEDKQQPDLYKKEADKIYSSLMDGSYGKLSVMLPTKNLWRASWAFDTLTDYFEVINTDGKDRSDKINHLEKAMMPTQNDDSYGFDPSGGNWWDDFGWSGIAALRASEKGFYKASKDFFFKTALNSWCYMYGNGWKPGTNSSDPPSSFTVPFEDSKWSLKVPNVGAPNCYTYNESIHEKSKPKYTPGGIWNHTLGVFDKSHQTATMPSCPIGSEAYLAPLQNTVTNAIFTVLTLRIYIAVTSGDWNHLLKKGNSKTLIINPSVILTAWENQMTWLSSWFEKEEVKGQSLKYRLSEGAFIRERVPQYDNGKWNSGYCAEAAWTGDQGLMLGALREAGDFLTNKPAGKEVSLKHPNLMQNVVPVYKEILIAVEKNAIAPEGYADGTFLKYIGNKTPFLRPWVRVSIKTEEPMYDRFSVAGGDQADYRTGVGVFCRYLLQCYNVEKDVVAPYKDYILNMANELCLEGFPTTLSDLGKEVTFLPCDGIIQQTNRSEIYDDVTAWINRLSILCLAYRLCEEDC